MAKPLDQLMQKDMSRAEFLATMGLGVASVLGFGRIVELLTGRSLHKNLSSHANVGYSSGDYGGKTEGSA
jgi:hypothetical protein